MGNFDVIVLGQGLAGTALAWCLRWSGSRVLVIDRESEGTASKIAAGLMTPVTGQKLAMTWRHDRLWPAAVSFYRRVEAETGSRFFRQLSMVRLFKSQKEVDVFRQRQAGDQFDQIVRQPIPLVDTRWFHDDLGGFEMAPAGQLEVCEYLRLSRREFARDGGYRASQIDVSRDIELAGDLVCLPRLDVSARWIIFCQGIDAIGNPWFRGVRFKPAKGEILTLRIPGLQETRVLHRGIWLVPLGNELFKAGSTYDWVHLDAFPTSRGREEIAGKLREFLRLSFEVISQEAAVRPVHRNQFPVLGIHPMHPQLGYFNGFGSKGSLQTPYFAGHFAAVLVGNETIDREVDLNRKATWPDESIAPVFGGPINVNSGCHVKRSPVRPLTEQAQDVVRNVLEDGEAAIDATAGNGHDTHFLARHVGPAGEVYAIDVQQSALDATSRRLAAANLQNVRLLNHDHGQLLVLIPPERRGRIGAIMFNLGYLPGGDKSITTNPTSTRKAILDAAELLKPGGVLTVVAYTGHDGGAAESATVADLLGHLPKHHFDVTSIDSMPGRTSGPKLFVVRKRANPSPDAQARDL